MKRPSDPLLRLTVRLTPRAGRDAIGGWERDREGRPYLLVRVSAPPVEDAANEALRALVAKALKRPKSAVTIAVGAKSRFKQLVIEGVEQADLARAFGPAP